MPELETQPKKPRKPYDRGQQPQYVDRRYDLLTHTWHWRVPSWKNTEAEPYSVHFNREKRRWECTCAHWINREIECKHIETVRCVIRFIREHPRHTHVEPTPVPASIERPVHGSLQSKGFALLS